MPIAARGGARVLLQRGADSRLAMRAATLLGLFASAAAETPPCDGGECAAPFLEGGPLAVPWRRFAEEFSHGMRDVQASPSSAPRTDGVAEGQFRYGDNWANFLEDVLHPTDPLSGFHMVNRAIVLSRELEDNFGIGSFAGKTFVDVGCGSGLISVAALLLNARRVISVDSQASSVRTTERLREVWRRVGLLNAEWIVRQGSILDIDFVSNLPKGDLVYSYGVLFTTGDFRGAMRNIARLVKEEGILFLGLHSTEMDNGHRHRWLEYKREYNRAPRWRKEQDVLIWLMAQLRDRCLAAPSQLTPADRAEFPGFQELSRCADVFFTTYASGRGMDAITDARDWLGGYPYEWITAEEVVEFFGRLDPPMQVVKVRHDAIAGYRIVPAGMTVAYFHAGRPDGHWWTHRLVAISPEDVRSLRQLRTCEPDDGVCLALRAAMEGEEPREAVSGGEECFAYLLSGPAAKGAALDPGASTLLRGLSINGWGAASADRLFCHPGAGARYRLFSSGLLLFSVGGSSGDPRTSVERYSLLQPSFYDVQLRLEPGAAAQSSTDGGAVAALAVDGRVSGNFQDGSCTMTELEREPWWSVELGVESTVKSVLIHNRGDCCSEQLFPFSVWLTAPGAESHTTGIMCGGELVHGQGMDDQVKYIQNVGCGIRGGKVWIVLEGRVSRLTLCEVQIVVMRVVER